MQQIQEQYESSTNNDKLRFQSMLGTSKHQGSFSLKHSSVVPRVAPSVRTGSKRSSRLLERRISNHCQQVNKGGNLNTNLEVKTSECNKTHARNQTEARNKMTSHIPKPKKQMSDLRPREMKPLGTLWICDSQPLMTPEKKEEQELLKRAMFRQTDNLPRYLDLRNSTQKSLLKSRSEQHHSEMTFTHQVENYEDAKVDYDFVFDRSDDYYAIPNFSQFKQSIEKATESKNLRMRRQFEGGAYEEPKQPLTANIEE